MERLRNAGPMVNTQHRNEDQARMLRAQQGQLVGHRSRRGGLVKLIFDLGSPGYEPPPGSDRNRV